MKLKIEQPNTRTGGNRPEKKGIRRRSLRGNEFFVFFIFLLISIGFWLLQSLQSSYRMRITIPVVYAELPTNVDYDKSAAPRSVVFVVEDKGMQLLLYSLKRFSPIKVKAQKKKSSIGKLEINTRTLLDEFQRQLATGTRIISASPPEISLETYTLKSKKLPIRLSFEPPIAPGYLLSSIKITPSEAIVYGNDEILAGLNALYTENIKQNPLKETQTLTIALSSPLGVELSVKEVNVKTSIDLLTEQSFDLPIDAIESPDGYRLRPLPGRARLFVTMPASRFGQVSASDFTLGVSYRSASDSSSTGRTLTVNLLQKPEWVTRYRIQPASVQYILENTQIP